MAICVWKTWRNVYKYIFSVSFRGNSPTDGMKQFVYRCRYKKQENEILTKYIEAAPREIFADILEKIDAFVYFDSRKKEE